MWLKVEYLVDRKTGKEYLKWYGALPEGNWVKNREKLARQVDGKRGGGGTRKYRRSWRIKKAKKAWDTIRNDASKLAYKTAIKQAKREVAKERNKAYEELYEKLETKEGKNEVFKIAKQRNRQNKNVQQIRVIKSKTGEILMEEEEVKQR